MWVKEVSLNSGTQKRRFLLAQHQGTTFRKPSKEEKLFRVGCGVGRVYSWCRLHFNPLYISLYIYMIFILFVHGELLSDIISVCCVLFCLCSSLGCSHAFRTLRPYLHLYVLARLLHVTDVLSMCYHYVFCVLSKSFPTCASHHRLLCMFNELSTQVAGCFFLLSAYRHGLYLNQFPVPSSLKSSPIKQNQTE